MASNAQEVFNAMLQVAIAQGLPGGNYTSKYSGEEIDADIELTVNMSAPEMHRMIFRGMNLGPALTVPQKNAIQDGSFKDLYLGDYWEIGGVKWRIVDIDYWYNTAWPPFKKHHLVIMPDTILGDAKQMNAENKTDTGYVGSAMRGEGINDPNANMANARNLCKSAFGTNILTYKETLVDAVSNGQPTSLANCEASIELPSEAMIYGYPYYNVMNNGSMPSLKVSTHSKTQLALFAVAPKFIAAGRHYWLRDVASATHFSNVSSAGIPDRSTASYSSNCIRPVFPVGVPDP